MSKRPVGTKAWGKRKTREEILGILRDERDRVVRTSKQQIMVTMGNMHRLLTIQEKVTLLRTSTLSQPLCKLRGVLFK